MKFSVRPPRPFLLAALLAAGLAVAWAQQRPEGGQRRGGQGGRGRQEGRGKGEARLPTLAFLTEVPAHPYDAILGRPTRDAVTLSLLAYQNLEVVVALGAAPGLYDRTLPARVLRPDEPAEILLAGLSPDTRYYYRVRSRPAGTTGGFAESAEYSFTTARPPGADFTFTISADSHLDFGTDVDVYKKSLANALAARPDFHVDLGDTFMTDKRNDYHEARPQYLAQRYYFGLLAPSAPLFLVLGNHDGEQPGKGGSDEMAVWSNGLRKKYFPNPEPNAFYTGNATPYPRAGLLQNYYAFEWGDALFVVLDPYWHSRQRGRDADNWGRTLGREQYEWLQRTLEHSRARFTFVFIHNLVGGESREGRGGAEAAAFFEWGGRDLDGRNTFAKNRPGWAAPIHDLLVKRGGGVAVFHGHDHLYVKQERDGIIYQLVPQPGHSRYDNLRSAEEYGYKSGIKQGASGILRVSVSPGQTLVEYVRAYPTAAEDGAHRTGAVTQSYTIKPR